jgi:hypothetical protein
MDSECENRRRQPPMRRRPHLQTTAALWQLRKMPGSELKFLARVARVKGLIFVTTGVAGWAEVRLFPIGWIVKSPTGNPSLPCVIIALGSLRSISYFSRRKGGNFEAAPR